MSFDLGAIDLEGAADRGAKMTLVHPVTSEPVGVTFTVIGSDGATYRRNLRAIRDKAAAKPEAEPIDPDTALKLALARSAAAAVTGWSTGEADTVVISGRAVPFSIEAAIDLMARQVWIADQVNAFRERRANFGQG